ncbi:hypothetical protein BH23ACT9_BH23ACT9_30890 [soil metagenome]
MRLLATDDLARLARTHGVATSYLDADDVERTPPVATIRAVLTAMGVPCGDDAAVRVSLDALETAGADRALPPTVVVRTDGDRAVRIDAVATPDSVLLRLEGGADPITLPVHRRAGGFVVDIPERATPGAHQIEIATGGVTQITHLLLVPPRCPLPDDDRRWG